MTMSPQYADPAAAAVPDPYSDYSAPPAAPPRDDRDRDRGEDDEDMSMSIYCPPGRPTVSIPAFKDFLQSTCTPVLLTTEIANQ